MEILNLTEEDKATRYKSTKLLTGEFVTYRGRPSQEFKNLYPVIAATLNGRGFRWLLPAEDWILRKLYNARFSYELEKQIDTSLLERALNDKRRKLLRDWQIKVLEDFVETIKSNKPYRKGLIVGLGGGKTLVALSLLRLSENSLYIAPRHLHSTIQDEAKKWRFEGEVRITTPESAHKFEPPKICVIDECLSVKNPSARRSQRVTELLKNTPVILEMTGTPLSAVHALDARWLRVLGSIVPEQEKHWKWHWGINPYYKDLAKLGVITRTNHRGEQIQPLEVEGWRFEEIAEFVRDYITIVDISDIMAEIPEATYQRIYFPRPGPYYAILKGLLTERSTSKRLTQARAASSGFVYSDQDTPIWIEKEPTKIKWIKNFLEDNPQEPVVLFSGWRAEIERLEKELADYNPAVVHDGKASRGVSLFTSGSTNVMICSANITEGMNLQRSRIGIFLSNSTNPTKRIQAEGRLYRQGQTRGVVFYDLLCSKTLDDRALDLLRNHKEENDKFVEAQLLQELRGLKK